MEKMLSDTPNYNPDEGTAKDNLKKAILVQARLIAELKHEVDKLKASKAERSSTNK